MFPTGFKLLGLITIIFVAEFSKAETLQDAITELRNSQQTNTLFKQYRKAYKEGGKDSEEAALMYSVAELAVMSKPADEDLPMEFEGLALLPSIIEQSQDPDRVLNARLALAQYYSMLGGHTQTITLLEPHLKDNPQDQIAWQTLGSALLGHSRLEGIFKNYRYVKRSRIALTRAYEIDPDNFDTLRALYRFHLEVPASYGGNKRQCLAFLNRAEDVNLDPRIRLDIERARVYLLLGNRRKASQYVKLALSKQPRYIDFFWGVRIMTALEQFDLAKDILARARREIPYSNSIWDYQEGRTLMIENKDTERAIQLIHSSIMEVESPPEEWPLDPIAWQYLQDLDAAYWRLGSLYDRLDNIPMAKQYYQRALRVNPDMKEASLSLLRLP